MCSLDEYLRVNKLIKSDKLDIGRDKLDHFKSKEEDIYSKMVGTKQRKELIGKFTTLRKDACKNGVSLAVIREVLLRSSDSNQEKNAEINGNSEKHSGMGYSGRLRFKKLPWMKHLFVILFILGSLCSGLVYYFRENLADSFEIYTSRCAIESNQFSIEVARPLVDCGTCLNLKSVPVEHNISAVDFLRNYAYTSVPVLIKDATFNWTAMNKFSYQFFKDLYLKTEGSLETQDNECQFFPYNTEFDTLGDVFNMTDSRANFTEGEKPWYIGW